MLFNSFFYLFAFLPITLITYFFLAKYLTYSAAKFFLVMASCFFYGWWNPYYLPLLFFSILVNYIIAHYLQTQQHNKKRHLILGVIFNIVLLGYFKYFNFFIDNLNSLFDASIEFKKIILPLGISFFCFTQIAYLVDIYRNKAKKYSILHYSLFVSYFPHLLAGPIIHHAQMMPQFENKDNAIINYKNIYFGLILFAIGLTKKVVLADSFALIANNGYAMSDSLNITTAWVTTLAYTFQIYFDFSGYTDMAIGASKFFNIELPINFNSPYQSLSIKEFWHRWHITLSNFLRDYLYIPLGGNRVSEMIVYRNLLFTFILGGIWHGAGWTFVIWGFLHGLALSVHRGFCKLKIRLPKIIAWLLTFNFVNLTWVFFRADSVNQAKQVIYAMLAFHTSSTINVADIYLFTLATFIILALPNSYSMQEKTLASRLAFIPVISLLIVISIIVMHINNSHEFIYYNF